MIEIFENVLLSQYTTIHTGGNARFFATCVTESDLKDALRFAKARNLKILVLGGGSNLLIRDQGFDGIVIHVCIQGINFLTRSQVEVGAGVNWDSFVEICCHRALSGIEVLSGIPGYVGATPVQNVGAYGQEVKHVITSVTAICRETLRENTFTTDECQFSYRHSIFKDGLADQWIITKVSFQLSPSHLMEVKHEEILRELTNHPHWSSESLKNKIQMIRNSVLLIRARKGMVVDPDDPDSRSLGSFFINPIVDNQTKVKVFERAESLSTPTRPVAYAMGDHHWKLSAAWLIENSGIKKGTAVGRARVSTKHVLAITNPDHASTSEILELAQFIKSKVHEQFSINLEQEPLVI